MCMCVCVYVRVFVLSHSDNLCYRDSNATQYPLAAATLMSSLRKLSLKN